MALRVVVSLGHPMEAVPVAAVALVLEAAAVQDLDPAQAVDLFLLPARLGTSMRRTSI